MKIWSKTRLDQKLKPVLIEKADLLDVLEFPDERLRQKSQPVESIDENLEKLVYDMLNTMYLTNGIGLAAPQIGKLLNLVVMDISKEKNSPMVLINPQIVWRSKETKLQSEGCLSVKVSEDLAKKLGVSFQSVNRWENGKYEPTKLAKAKLNELFKQYNVEETE